MLSKVEPAAPEKRKPLEPVENRADTIRLASVQGRWQSCMQGTCDVLHGHEVLLLRPKNVLRALLGVNLEKSS